MHRQVRWVKAKRWAWVGRMLGRQRRQGAIKADEATSLVVVIRAWCDTSMPHKRDRVDSGDGPAEYWRVPGCWTAASLLLPAGSAVGRPVRVLALGAADGAAQQAKIMRNQCAISSMHATREATTLTHLQ